MSILKALIGVAALPFDVAKDVVTLGGAATDEESSIGKRIDHISKNIDKATKP